MRVYPRVRLLTRSLHAFMELGVWALPFKLIPQPQMANFPMIFQNTTAPTSF